MKLPHNRVVWISGASSGIGRATAIAFAKDGARVALASRREAELRKVCEEIRSFGAEALLTPCDVRERTQVEASIGRTVETFGGLHVIVNNAGFGVYGGVDDLSDRDLEDIFRVNVFGPIYAIQFGLQFLKETKAGQIINITSVLARTAVPYMAAYCATKHALHAITKSLRVELQDSGVRVIEVGPGLTATGFQKNARAEALGGKPLLNNRSGASAESVARSILRASHRGGRETWLTLGGQSLIFLQERLPRLTDWGLARWGRSIRSRP